jgi:aspartate racemase
MKTIGLLGGMSWESSIEYYRIINETIRVRLGGLHSAASIMVSVDFADIETMQREGRWDDAAQLLIFAARQAQRGGADLLLLCTNTMHKVAGQIQSAVNIPLLHIADPTAAVIRAQELHCIGLLGTRFTMEEGFYKDRLIQKHGDREVIHHVIYDELVLGNILPDSRSRYLDIIQRLAARGAQGIILGCTEIGLLVRPSDTDVPLFDTTKIHAVAAVDLALKG